MKCPFEKECGGCRWINLPDDEQRNLKIEKIQNLLKSVQQEAPIEFHSLGPFAERTRFDFTIIDGKMGLFSKNNPKELVPIDSCKQLHPELQKFYEQVQQIHFPIHKGSLRIRIGKDGITGIWLDFSNVDIKALLDGKTTLHQLAEIATVIEIGQKRKTYNKRTGKLADPQLHPWFPTWHQEKKVWLEQHIGSFSQSGELANKVITKIIARNVDRLGAKQVVEFGSGFGNLTLAAHAPHRQIHGFEFDSTCKAGIEKTLSNHPEIDSQEIQIHMGDYQNKTPEIPSKTDLLLVNPPRSGLKKFVSLAENTYAKNIIYMSCYPESFSVDFIQLEKYGFKIKEIDLVDQFPQTDHIELIAILQRP